MTEPTSDETGPDLRAVGQRIELLLDRLERTVGDAFREVEELVRLLTDLYGAGLVRALELAGPEQIGRFAADEVIGSLMLVHGVHPDGLDARAAAAVASVAPLAASAGASVELVSVSTAAGTVHLCVTAAKPAAIGGTIARAVEAAVPDATVTVSLQESGTPIRLGRKPVSVP